MAEKMTRGELSALVLMAAFRLAVSLGILVSAWVSVLDYKSEAEIRNRLTELERQIDTIRDVLQEHAQVEP